MIDVSKLKKLAKVMVNYSVAVKKGEKVLLRGYGFDGYPLIKEIYRECVKAGATVDVRFSKGELSRIFFEEASDDQLKVVTALDKKVADSYDAMIQIVADENKYEMSGLDNNKLKKSMKARKPLSDILHKKRWCLFYYPNAASASFAKKPIEEWQNFVLDSSLLDWPKVEKFENKFVALMKKVDEVRIVGKETDLTLRIGDQKWQTCCGKRNLPDGEIYTSPIKTSANGVIRYNISSHYRGNDFDWVKFWIKDGKVVREESSNLKALTDILDTDKGARYFGEFAFGLNERIKRATRQILFDEKMGKSLHMALGQCYDVAPNGNDSNVHWDLVFKFKLAKAKLYFDGKEVFSEGKWKDKRFVFLNKGI